jgi:hypothetical protein
MYSPSPESFNIREESRLEICAKFCTAVAYPKLLVTIPLNRNLRNKPQPDSGVRPMP